VDAVLDMKLVQDARHLRLPAVHPTRTDRPRKNA
jgi:hypothetical protein